MNSSFKDKVLLYDCSIRQEIDIQYTIYVRFYYIGVMYKFSKNINLFLKDNLTSLTARAEMTSLFPTLSVIFPSPSCLKELVSCKEEQTWLVAPESSIQSF